MSIKFRAWNTAAKMWQTEWTALMMDGKPLVLMPGGEYWPSAEVALVFSQFTTLFDKHGQEIYNGDILRFKSGKVGQVIFRDGCWTVSIVGLAGDPGALSYYCNGYYGGPPEIIGNIYQDPELLES